MNDENNKTNHKGIAGSGTVTISTSLLYLYVFWSTGYTFIRVSDSMGDG